MLEGLGAELTVAGIRLQVVEARSAVRDMLRTEGLGEKLGATNRFISVADAVDDFQNDPAGSTRETP
jgi:sulfate permease, SulP family